MGHLANNGKMVVHLGSIQYNFIVEILLQNVHIPNKNQLKFFLYFESYINIYTKAFSRPIYLATYY